MIRKKKLIQFEVLGVRCDIDASSAQITDPGLFEGFSFHGLKKLKWGDSWIHSTTQRKEHSKTEFGKKNSEKNFGDSEAFYRSKFSHATGVKDFRWFIRHLNSVVKSARLNKFSYPQVPGSIPAENTSTQIHMDLSK